MAAILFLLRFEVYGRTIIKLLYAIRDFDKMINCAINNINFCAVFNIYCMYRNLLEFILNLILNPHTLPLRYTLLWH